MPILKSYHTHNEEAHLSQWLLNLQDYLWKNMTLQKKELSIQIIVIILLGLLKAEDFPNKDWKTEHLWWTILALMNQWEIFYFCMTILKI